MEKRGYLGHQGCLTHLPYKCSRAHTFFLCFFPLNALPQMATKVISSSSPAGSFEDDCREIHDSGGRLTHLLQVLAQRTRLERHQIKETYQKMYGEDLLHRLKAANGTAMSPEARFALSIFLMDPHERDAVLAREALEQSETNYRALAEIFIGRKSSYVVLLRQAYHTKFRRQLDQDIINMEPAHPFQRVNQLEISNFSFRTHFRFIHFDF